MEKLKILRANEVATLSKNCYESLYWKKNLLVCGLDEAGRGPLAGPLVAAAVILPNGTKYRLLKDSKIMTPQERERAFIWICANAAYGLGIVPLYHIDQHNIWHATLWGMRRAVLQLLYGTKIQPGAFLVDAMPLSLMGTPYERIPVHAFVYGEQLSCSVAAASIVAKVVRDRIMEYMAPCFPLYKLEKNKGYATSEHCEYLQQHGQSLAHRVSYMTSLEERVLGIKHAWKQQQLC
jgi:ribonuclease HII